MNQESNDRQDWIRVPIRGLRVFKASSIQPRRNSGTKNIALNSSGHKLFDRSDNTPPGFRNHLKYSNLNGASELHCRCSGNPNYAFKIITNGLANSSIWYFDPRRNNMFFLQGTREKECECGTTACAIVHSRRLKVSLRQRTPKTSNRNRMHPDRYKLICSVGASKRRPRSVALVTAASSTTIVITWRTRSARLVVPVRRPQSL